MLPPPEHTHAATTVSLLFYVHDVLAGNETLRSHMFRAHGISRMFMCRCCNWAFPDKTSLHIHMQSMMRNGHPGDVSVLARSSTDGPGMAGRCCLP